VDDGEAFLARARLHRSLQHLQGFGRLGLIIHHGLDLGSSEARRDGQGSQRDARSEMRSHGSSLVGCGGWNAARQRREGGAVTMNPDGFTRNRRRVLFLAALGAFAPRVLPVETTAPAAPEMRLVGGRLEGGTRTLRFRRGERITMRWT